MNQISLKSLLEAEIDGAIGYLQTETTEQRTRSLEYYLRYPYGNEVEGRSQIVTGEVAEVIDGAIPQLIRIFTASDDIIRYEPVGPGDEQGAHRGVSALAFDGRTQLDQQVGRQGIELGGPGQPQHGHSFMALYLDQSFWHGGSRLAWGQRCGQIECIQRVKPSSQWISAILTDRSVELDAW